MKHDLLHTQPGHALPPAPKPAGNYAATVRAGNFLFVSGQFSTEDGAPKYRGRVGAELSQADGYAAARLAALNALAHIQEALGSLDHLEQLVRVEGHVASAPGWGNAPKVLDGASDLFVEALGERGRHTRSAFTPTQLPMNHVVELVVTATVKSART
jgi:enamine deaminase RidA (YjgF/YER057c/UK114 family)